MERMKAIAGMLGLEVADVEEVLTGGRPKTDSPMSSAAMHVWRQDSLRRIDAATTTNEMKEAFGGCASNSEEQTQAYNKWFTMCLTPEDFFEMASCIMRARGKLDDPLSEKIVTLSCETITAANGPNDIVSAFKRVPFHSDTVKRRAIQKLVAMMPVE